MKNVDRRIRRTQKALHDALIALALEKNYDSITVQEILDRADIARSTFYLHFQGKNELLISGMEDLRNTLNTAIEQQRGELKNHEILIAFSEAMFKHANDYRNIYDAILHTSVWPVVRNRLQQIIEELIRRECKAEIAKLKRVDSEVPVDLFVHYLTNSFSAVLMWWLDRHSRLKPSEINLVFRSLVLPTIDAVLG